MNESLLYIGVPKPGDMAPKPPSPMVDIIPSSSTSASENSLERSSTASHERIDPRSMPPPGRIFEDLREAEALLAADVRRDLGAEELLLGRRWRREREKNDSEPGVGGWGDR